MGSDPLLFAVWEVTPASTAIFSFELQFGPKLRGC